MQEKSYFALCHVYNARCSQIQQGLRFRFLHFNLWISSPLPLTNTQKECPHKHTHFFGLLLVIDLQADDNIQVFQIFQRIRSHENERNFTLGNKNYIFYSSFKGQEIYVHIQIPTGCNVHTHVGMSVCRQIHTHVYIHRHRLLAAEA